MGSFNRFIMNKQICNNFVVIILITLTVIYLNSVVCINTVHRIPKGKRIYGFWLETMAAADTNYIQNLQAR